MSHNSKIAKTPRQRLSLELRSTCRDRGRTRSRNLGCEPVSYPKAVRFDSERAIGPDRLRGAHLRDDDGGDTSTHASLANPRAATAQSTTSISRAPISRSSSASRVTRRSRTADAPRPGVGERAVALRREDPLHELAGRGERIRGSALRGWRRCLRAKRGGSDRQCGAGAGGEDEAKSSGHENGGCGKVGRRATP